MIQQCRNSTRLVIPAEAMDVPESLQINHIRNWTQFGIWGLVFYDNQPPWFALIECMHILFHRHIESAPSGLFEPLSLVEDLGGRANTQPRFKHESVKYCVSRNSVLRHLLFRDTDITDPNLSATWGKIKHRTKTRYESWPHDLDHLSKVFVDEASFHRAVSLLRSAEVEAGSAKRWTSRHLLPLGPNMLFADIGTAEKGARADRRFMRRSGEMLYLMLGRSDPDQRKRAEALLQERLLSRETPWNRLAMLIGSGNYRGTSGGSVELRTGYLPFPRLELYDYLAEDWISLLSLRGMQIEELLDPLMRVSALHLIIYLLDRASKAEGLSPRKFPPFIFDLSAARSGNEVRRMAIAQYDSHIKLPKKAIESYLDGFSQSEFWTGQSGNGLKFESAKNRLRDMFRFQGTQGRTPAAMLEDLQSDALSSNHSIWSTIASLAKGSGISTSRQGVGTWYAPDDAFLGALVLVNVQGPMELGVFVQRLYSRYRIVIGQRQALDYFGSRAAFLEPLKENERCLEDRLRTLGFLDRKSDACAFVKNPFHKVEQ